MSHFGDLTTLVPTVQTILEKEGGTALAKQVPNMGVEVEYACEMSPEECADHLNNQGYSYQGGKRKDKRKRVGGARVKFEGQNSYGSMWSQKEGRRRLWAITQDQTATDSMFPDPPEDDGWGGYSEARQQAAREAREQDAGAIATEIYDELFDASRRYAVQQVERAKEEAIEQARSDWEEEGNDPDDFDDDDVEFDEDDVEIDWDEFDPHDELDSYYEGEYDSVSSSYLDIHIDSDGDADHDDIYQSVYDNLDEDVYLEAMEDDEEEEHTWGCEMVSPRIGMTDDNIKKVWQVFHDSINSCDGRTHSNAGLHVHVGYRKGIRPIHITKLMYHFAKMGDKVQDSALRDFRYYAGSVASYATSIDRAAQAAAKSGDANELLRAVRSASHSKTGKYQLVNVTGNTVEIRLGSSELVDNQSDWVKWFKLIRDAYSKAVEDEWLHTKGESEEGHPQEVRFTIGTRSGVKVQVKEGGKWVDKAHAKLGTSNTYEGNTTGFLADSEPEIKQAVKDATQEAKAKAMERGIPTNLAPGVGGIMAAIHLGQDPHYDPEGGRDIDRARTRAAATESRKYARIYNRVVYDRVTMDALKAFYSFAGKFLDYDESPAMDKIMGFIKPKDGEKDHRAVGKRKTRTIPSREGSLWDISRTRDEERLEDPMASEPSRDRDKHEYQDRMDWTNANRTDIDPKHDDDLTPRQRRRQARAMARQETYQGRMRSGRGEIRKALKSLKRNNPDEYKARRKEYREASKYSAGKGGDPRKFNRWARSQVPSMFEGWEEEIDLLVETMHEALLLREAMSPIFG